MRFDVTEIKNGSKKLIGENVTSFQVLEILRRELLDLESGSDYKITKHTK